MHGRVKVKTTSQKELEKKLEKEEKCKQFLSGQKKAFEKRADGQFDRESLAITGQLLSANPDFSTLWNYRREVLLYIQNETKDEDKSDSFETLCRNELQLTENCLRVNPKSYCIWHQRTWIIEKMANPDLKTEIELCNQCLRLDERNFHCWDYRRFVSKLAQIDVKEELSFTLQKIEQNFSNFSSWYYRSCLFTSAANNENLDFTKEWKKEYDLVENAIFTDPSDQSAWFYHKWLVSTNYGQHMKHLNQMNARTSVKINRIVLNQRQSLLIIGLSRPLRHKPLITVAINGKYLTEIEWNSTASPTSHIWFTRLDSLSMNEFKELSINPIPTFAINPECIEPINIRTEESIDSQLFVWERKTEESEKVLGLEDSYLQTLRELHKLEPNNKWVNLTLAWSDPNSNKTVDIFDSLIKLDPLRRNYYNDLKSKMILKERIESLQTIGSVLLNNLNISALYDCNRLTHIQRLDLSDNNLLKLSQTFNQLVSLEVFILDSNRIYTIDKEFQLKSLKCLSLNKNKIFKTDCLANLRNSSELRELLIKENPISSALKDIKNSELLLSDGLKIISYDSDNTSNHFLNIIQINNDLKVFYNLF